MKKQLLILTATIFCLNIFAQTPPSYIPTNGLQSWYPFNGNANDESGIGNNCTTFNSPTLSPDRYGNANASYFFDGIDDWIETNAFFLKGDSTHSISMWFKSTDSTKINQTLFNTSPHTMENFSYHYNSSGTPPYGLSFGIGDGAGSWSIQHPDLGQITTPPTLGQWHHVVWTKDALLNWRFYMDTVLLATFNSVTNTGSTLANLRFGAENNGFPTGGANFLGYLDDIGVWNRELTSTEIKDIYFGPTAGIKNSNSENKISIYPNPTNDFIFIKSVNKISGQKYFVTDCFGRQVLVGQFSSENSGIDLSSLSNGFYFLNWKNQIAKIIKN